MALVLAVRAAEDRHKVVRIVGWEGDRRHMGVDYLDRMVGWGGHRNMSVGYLDRIVGEEEDRNMNVDYLDRIVGLEEGHVVAVGQNKRYALYRLVGRKWVALVRCTQLADC